MWEGPQAHRARPLRGFSPSWILTQVSRRQDAAEQLEFLGGSLPHRHHQDELVRAPMLRTAPRPHTICSPAVPLTHLACAATTTTQFKHTPPPEKNPCGPSKPFLSIPHLRNSSSASLDPECFSYLESSDTWSADRTSCP